MSVCAGGTVNDRLVEGFPARWRAGLGYVTFALRRPEHFTVMFDAPISRGQHPDSAAAGEQAFSTLIGFVKACQEASQLPSGSPWQNGVAERWVGSCRRELLDHVIVLSESHLRRLVGDYLQYYHEDRIHDAVKKQTPAARVIGSRPSESAKVSGAPRLGGLHHRYHWQTAA